MRPLFALVVSVFLGTMGRASAAPPAAEVEAREPLAEAARFRFDLRAGLGVRHDRLSTSATRIGANGAALSDFVLGGAWFGTRSPLGLAARFELDHFGLRGDSG